MGEMESKDSGIRPAFSPSAQNLLQNLATRTEF